MAVPMIPTREDLIWTELLHIYPEYSVELQIHGYKFAHPNADLSFSSKYRVKILVAYNKNESTYDPSINKMVQTIGQEQWINPVFSSKMNAQAYCRELAAKEIWGQNGFNHNET